MRLYQFAFGYQPHYVVAKDFGDAERLIHKHNYSFTEIKDLGPYIILDAAIDHEATEPDAFCDSCDAPMWESNDENCSTFIAYGLETVACRKCRGEE
jgi:hypothetical protein